MNWNNYLSIQVHKFLVKMLSKHQIADPNRLGLLENYFRATFKLLDNVINEIHFWEYAVENI